MRRVVVGAALLVAIVAAIAIAAHAPPVRRAVLRYAVASLEGRFRLRIGAGRLDYNLASLTVSIGQVSVAANHTPDMPFFQADSLSVRLPRSVLGGPLAFGDVAVQNGRVRIVRTASGTNLPRLDEQAAGDPDVLRINHLSIPALAVTIQDEVAGVSIDVPAASVVVSSSEGRVALDAPATVAFSGRTLRLSRVDGAVTFDGRNIGLRALHLETPELAMNVDGTLALMTREPNLRLRMSGTGNIARLSRLAGAGAEGLDGTASIEGTVEGPFGQPTGDLRVRSAMVNWQGLSAHDVQLRARVDASRLDITEFRFIVADGRVSAAGRIEFEVGGAQEIKAAWEGVDVEALAASFVNAGSWLPTGRSDGELQARTTDGIDGLIAGATVRVTGGENGPQRLRAPGESRLRVVEQVWQLEGTHEIANLAATFDLNGRVPANAPVTHSSLAGTVDFAEADVAAMLDTLKTLGILVGEREWTATGSVRAAGTLRGSIGTPLWEVNGELSNGRAAFREGETNLQGRVKAVGANDRALVTGILQHSATRWGEFAIPDGSIGLDLDNATATIRMAPSTLTGLRLFATVATTSPYRSDVDASLEEIELSQAVRAVERLESVTGRANVHVNFQGPLGSWRDGTGVLQVQLQDAAIGALSVDDEQPLQVSYSANRIDVVAGEFRAGAARITVSGGLPLDGSTLDAVVVNASGDVGDLAQAAELTGLIDLPVVGGSGPAKLVAYVRGPIDQPRVSGGLDVGPASIALEGLPLITDIRVRASLEDQNIQLSELAARYQGASATATGSIPLTWVSGADPASATVTPARLAGRVVNIGPAVLEPFMDRTAVADIAGSVDLSVDVSSPSARVATLTGRATLDRMDVRLAGLPLTQQTPTAVTFGNGFARIESWAWAGQGARLDVVGQVRLDDLQSGLVARGEIDGRMLTPFIRDLGVSTAGILTPRVSITGPLTAPRVDGDVTIATGEVRLVNPRIILTELQGRAVLTRSTATLAGLTGSINGGTLSLSGNVEVAARDAIRATLSSVIRGMPIEIPDGLRSEVDADLSFTATRTLDADVNTTSSRLNGMVTVLRGAYREPLALLGGVLSAVQTQGADTSTAQSPFLESLTLDVRIVTDDDLIVDNNTARLAAGADLRVIGTAAAPGLGGRADLREGGRIFLGRNVYTITSGRIDFTDATTVRPEANIDLATRAGGEEIEVSLTGPLNSPSVTLSSPNPDLSQADLTALLVTGRRFDELASADAALISTAVVGNLAGDVLGFAGRGVGLDTLRLGGADTETTRGDLTAVAAEVDPSLRLTFGKNIGSNLEVTLSQSLRDADAQTWIVDYLPSRRILLRLVSDDDDLRSYAFRHDVVVGAPMVARQEVSARPEPGAVTRLTFTGDLGVEESRLRRELRLEEGDRFDFIAWQDDRERLEQFYRQANRLAARISASRADENGGVVLSYAISAGPETRVVVNGWTPDEATLDRIRDAWSISIVDDLLKEEAEALIGDALSRNGYLRPRVSAMVVADPDVSTLRVEAVPGPQTTTARVTFSGVSDETARELEAWSQGNGALQAVRDPSAFETAVTDFLRRRGYLDAQVRAGAPSISGTEADVNVVINSGPPIVVQGVAFVGNSLPEERLIDVAALQMGGPLDPVAVDDARTRLLALYRGEGFPAVEISATPSQGTVAFTIAEGARQVIADIAVSGQGRIDADVITRALQLPAGVPVRSDDLLAARRRLFDTGLFRRVDVTTEPLGDEAPASATIVPMRVQVLLEQWPTLRFRYGVELTEEREDAPTDGDLVPGRDLVPGLSADISRRTLFGRPIAVGLAGRYQKRQRRGTLFVSSPTFLSLPLESSLTLERSRQEFAADTLLTDVGGFAWEQRVRLLRHLQLSYAYRYERNHTYETNPTPNDPFPDFDLTVHLARLLGGVSWDSRSQPDEPMRGSLISGSLEWTPSAVGSDFEYFRYVLQGYRFIPWRGVIFASAARFGSVRGIGGQEVIPSERFYAGGARSVRGVAEDGLGERDFFGAPTGGEMMLVLNQEARFPIYGWLRGVGFVDAGNVFRTRTQFSLADLTVSVGAGLRLATPFALLRADVARVLETGGSRWTFGIGHAF